MQVHAIAFAVAEHLAVGAYSLFGPTAVAIGFEAIVPDIHEVILINVSLMEVRADTGTTGNGTVYQHRSYTDAGVTFIESIAYLAFIIPQETFTAVTGSYHTFLATLTDEVEYGDKLPVV